MLVKSLDIIINRIYEYDFKGKQKNRNNGIFTYFSTISDENRLNVK